MKIIGRQQISNTNIAVSHGTCLNTTKQEQPTGCGHAQNAGRLEKQRLSRINAKLDNKILTRYGLYIDEERKDTTTLRADTRERIRKLGLDLGDFNEGFKRKHGFSVMSMLNLSARPDQTKWAIIDRELTEQEALAVERQKAA